MHRRIIQIVLMVALLAGIHSTANAQDLSARYYNIGSPVTTDIWVDPVHGNDANSGATRLTAVKTVVTAWRKVPVSTTLTHAYRILLTAGNYPESSMPSSNWFELRHGTAACPVIIQAADGAHTARLHAYLSFDHCSYLYLINLDFVTDRGYGGGGNVIHYSFSDHLLLRGCVLNGFDGSVRQPQETLKVNQCQYMYVEDCDISNAFWMGLDYVAVQYGHIQGNKIHDTDNDCLMVKGGSAYLRIEGNEVYNCQQCGLVAGQGTTFGFMVTPWLHYEVYDTKFINNVVHDVQNAGIAARGAYNVLFAHNTFYRVGIDQTYGAGLILCSPGGRVCQGDLEICLQLHNLGGWGQTAIGDEVECIPNRNVYIYNNIFYNPPGVQTMYSHFVFFGPQTPPLGTNIPGPVRSDDNLRIKGNIIWDGPTDWPSGIDTDTGCQPSNPTCNETLLRSQNAINTIRPQFVDTAHGNFRPLPGGNIYQAATYPIPSFPGNDRQAHPLAPLGNLSNGVLRDLTGRGRPALKPAGAYAEISSDFNGDGTPEIVMENLVLGQVRVLSMRGATVIGSVPISQSFAQTYRVVGNADFNGDGWPDLAFYSASLGLVKVWYLHGTQVISGGQIGGTLPTGYSASGVGDFNGDGHPDLVLSKTSTNQAMIWFLNDRTFVSSAPISSSLAGARISAVADFNNDGLADIALENSLHTIASVWLMNGATQIGQGTFAVKIVSPWRLACADDLDGDGHPDLAFNNAAANTGYLCYMNGISVVGSGPLSQGLGTGWHLVGSP